MIKLLALVSVFSLPFTYGMTIQAKFPLKIYEVSLALAGCLFLWRGRLRIPRGLRREVRLLFLFCAVVAGLFLWRLLFPAEVSYRGAFESRFGPLGDGLAKIAYLAMAVFGFCVVAYCAFVDPRAVVRAWLVGAVLAAGYLWYTFFCGLLDVDPLRLPGVDHLQVDHHAGITFYRSGTFLEGNYAGLYFLLSGAVALFDRRRKLAGFMALALVPTLSTISWLACFAITAVLAVRWTREHVCGKKYAVVAALVACVALTGWGLQRTGYLNLVMFKKLGADRLQRRDSSYGDRMNLTVSGLRMFAAHPIAGVGISQYGYQYRQYQSTRQYDWMHPGKVIPNNVYVELLSELGLPGFLLFLAFLGIHCGSSGGADLAPLRYGLVAMLIVFVAFSAYSMFYLWAYWGLVSGVSCRLSYENGPH